MGYKNLKDAAAGRLFVAEWATHLGFSDQTIAERLRVSRETVFRWRKEPHRMNAPKLGLLARTMGIEPQDFWSDPKRPSWDYLLRNLPGSQRRAILKLFADVASTSGAIARL
jgi:hypothetical protein